MPFLAMLLAQFVSVSVYVSVCLHVSVCLSVGSRAIPGNATGSVRANHHRPCSVLAQTSDWQILLSHLPCSSRSRLDLLCAATHHWQVGTHFLSNTHIFITYSQYIVN